MASVETNPTPEINGMVHKCDRCAENECYVFHADNYNWLHYDLNIKELQYPVDFCPSCGLDLAAFVQAIDYNIEIDIDKIYEEQIEVNK